MAPKSPSGSLSNASGLSIDCSLTNSNHDHPSNNNSFGSTTVVIPPAVSSPPVTHSIPSSLPTSGLLASSPVSGDHLSTSHLQLSMPNSNHVLLQNGHGSSPGSNTTTLLRATPKNRRSQTEIEIPETINRKKDSSLSVTSRSSLKPSNDCFTALMFDEDDEQHELRSSSDEHLNSLHSSSSNNSSSSNGNSTAPAATIATNLNGDHLPSHHNLSHPPQLPNSSYTSHSYRSYSHSPIDSTDHTLPSYADPSPSDPHSLSPTKPVKGSTPGYARFQATTRYASNGYLKTTLAFFYAVIGMTSNLFVLAWVHERVPMDAKVLPDLGFDLFPRVDWLLNMSEYIIVGEVTALIATIFLHRYRQLLLRRMCLIMGTLYIFRAVCMASTVFPMANDKYYCSPQLRDPAHPDRSIPLGQHIAVVFQRVGHMLGGIGLSISGKQNYCGDYMYSGHTVTLTFCYLFIREYAFPLRLRTLSLKIANLLLLGCSFTGVICVIISRGHYLIDILVAYYVTTRLFWIYHTMAHNQMLMIRTPSNYLSNVWWFRLFLYFEMNCSVVNDVGSLGSSSEHLHRSCACPRPKYCECSLPAVSRIFEWPLPWPRWFRRRSALLPCHQRLLPQQHA